jgi:hypothetical protein
MRKTAAVLLNCAMSLPLTNSAKAADPAFKAKR